jgi:hypothetical protein
MNNDVRHVTDRTAAPARRLARRLRVRSRWALGAAILALALVPQSAHASMFHGETLDSIANALSWVVLAVVPVVGIAVFWLVHILPEKIAEKKGHPQAKAIQTLCLLSLFFGGLLWPLAWLWAYTKPVMHKMAYGTDVDPSHAKEPHAPAVADATKAQAAEAELERIREQVRVLAEQLQVGAKGRKA